MTVVMTVPMTAVYIVRECEFLHKIYATFTKKS